ncbi:hypothetical protein AB0G86_18995 [Streptomyces scabiei]
MAGRKVSARTGRPQEGTRSLPAAGEDMRVVSGRLIAGPVPVPAG